MLAVDVLKMVHGLERKEAAASSMRGFSAVARLYAAAADAATAADLRLALLAEVVRLADDSTASLAQAALHQQDIANELVVTVLKERQRSKARRKLGTVKATAEP